MLLSARSLAVAVLLLCGCSGASVSRKGVAIYADSECSEAPLTLQVVNANSSNCTPHDCSAIEFADKLYHYTINCTDVSAHALVATAFVGTRYIMFDRFKTASNCSDDAYLDTHALQDSKQCIPYAIDVISNAGNASSIATILDDRSVSVLYFNGGSCSHGFKSASNPNKTAVATNACNVDQDNRFYISTATLSSSTSSVTSADIDYVTPEPSVTSSPLSETSENERSSHAIPTTALLIATVSILCVVAVIALRLKTTKKTALDQGPANMSDSVAILEPDDLVYLSKSASKRDFFPQTSSMCSTYREQVTTRSFAPQLSSFGSGHRSAWMFAPGSSTSSTFQSSNTVRAWEDDVVVAARIPRDKVVVTQLLSRGGFGVVYSGMYNSRRVAVKMLLPETRRSISHVADLLAEVKMMAAMEHPHIVEFIGVAWDSLTNMCVVTELMAGGDLKGLLHDFEEQKCPTGFSRDKLKIALHVAHALTYMHSLDPPVIHRDLKSKNILLSEQLDAKLTDFGTSRERVNESMTGGVGTCLWMAPEVMIGDRYDDKADMFSFGVVLSELDTHAAPYSHAKDPNDSSRQMPEPAILQMVATGKLQVKFTGAATMSIVKLGAACVSVDPKARPTASEALYRLHTILADDKV